MKSLIYLISGVLFALGLSLSGMINPLKVKEFLSFGFDDWNPALIFVLGAAVPVYLIAFLYLRRKKITLIGGEFRHPAKRLIDKKLVLGSVVFGIGWGIAGVCPGPALVRIAFLDINLTIFIVTMMVGFELQRRLT